MKIALINENSQAAKNGIIEAALKKVVEPMGHEVVNYGMYAADDAAQLTYVQCGILAAILLNSGAADYVITGCGTGEGAMLALNSFPGVICGHVEDPVDAYTFAHVNDGNAVAMPVVSLTAETDLELPTLGDGTRALTYEGTVPGGATLVFDSALRRVLLDGVDVTAYTEGDFPELAPGNTTLEYTGDPSGSHFASGVATFRDRWW